MTPPRAEELQSAISLTDTDRPLVDQSRDIEVDVVVVGAGPNGLITALYLAAAGLQVAVAEKRYEIGGGLATEEVLFPGYYANTHATYHYMVDFMPVLSDFELSRHGLRFYKPSLQAAGDIGGEKVRLYRALDDTRDFLARNSIAEADSFATMAMGFRRIVGEIIGPATYLPPLPPLDTVEKMGTTSTGQALLDVSEMSAVEVVSEAALSDPVTATLLYMSCQWGISPQESGMGFMVPLLIDRGLQKAFCYGGSHRMASAISRELLLRGGMVLDNSEVVSILVDGSESRASGVVMADGRTVHARHAVVSSLDPRTTFMNLLGEGNLDRNFAEAVGEWKYDKWSLFTAFFVLERSGTGDGHVRESASGAGAAGGRGGTHGGPGTEARAAGRMNRTAGTQVGQEEPFLEVIGFDSTDDVIAVLEAVEGGDLPKLAGHLTMESELDTVLAPRDGRVVGFFQMPAPYDFPWEEKAGEVTDQAVSLLSSHVPGFRERLVRIKLETPRDIERRLASMVRGSIKHGDYNPLQMGYMRPNIDCSDTRTPVAGLYLCGASVYPGGMIIGGPGYLAARAISSDLGVTFPFSVPGPMQRYVDTYLNGVVEW